ncbi:hypothetical protein [Rubinisphaera italica]|uniref:Uncharacterized protein n=1 Tax=Rubinisphaera italica TaxID=2527969 RepID=A0A5C5XMR8_9PLAN|nr:hypothetical protein [Rubinisphaera italica]TWT64194.1 hypothetical protein Pan54_49550 [Rubinisphaera italica]
MTEYGMAAFGRSGDWELAVDEILGERQHWCLQIESPFVSLQCGIPCLDVFAELKHLLAKSDSNAYDENNSVEVGLYYDRPVIVHRDNEFADRCFIIIGDSAEARFEVTLAGKNFNEFREALSQVVEELDQ